MKTEKNRIECETRPCSLSELSGSHMDRGSLIKKSVTQRAIAEAAGVSASLVSRVLSNNVQHISVSEEKILRIKRIATEAGYYVL